MTLKDGYYMLWVVGGKHTPEKAIEHFKAKYGYKPTEIAIGKGVEFKTNLNIVDIMCPDKSIKLR